MNLTEPTQDRVQWLTCVITVINNEHIFSFHFYFLRPSVKVVFGMWG